MKKLLLYGLAMAGLAVLASSCRTRQLPPTTAGRLVGTDRDSRGCLRSAGYTWSNALHDCVRIWEAGVRLERERRSVFVIFSEDSLYAELTDGSATERPLCRRVRGTDVWRNTNTREQVMFKDNRICATLGDSATYYSESCVDLIRRLQGGPTEEADTTELPDSLPAPPAGAPENFRKTYH